MGSRKVELEGNKNEGEYRTLGKRRKTWISGKVVDGVKTRRKRAELRTDLREGR